MASCVVLLSAGLDSTVNLAAALQEMPVRLALTFNYGQKAASKELLQAQKIADHYKVPHKEIDLLWFKDFTHTALVNADKNVPVAQAVQIDDLNTSQKTAERVWVPNRNGIFLNIAAAYAESLNAEFVVPGFNFEEAQTFSDNTDEFLSAMSESLSFSTATDVKAKCFTTHMNKSEIVKLGQSLNAPFDLMWSCYLSQETMCGECESCQRFFRAVNVI